MAATSSTLAAAAIEASTATTPHVVVMPSQLDMTGNKRGKPVLSDHGWLGLIPTTILCQFARMLDAASNRRFLSSAKWIYDMGGKRWFASPMAIRFIRHDPNGTRMNTPIPMTLVTIMRPLRMNFMRCGTGDIGDSDWNMINSFTSLTKLFIFTDGRDTRTHGRIFLSRLTGLLSLEELTITNSRLVVHVHDLLTFQKLTKLHLDGYGLDNIVDLPPTLVSCTLFSLLPTESSQSGIMQSLARCPLLRYLHCSFRRLTINLTTLRYCINAWPQLEHLELCLFRLSNHFNGGLIDPNEDIHTEIHASPQTTFVAFTFMTTRTTNHTYSVALIHWMDRLSNLKTMRCSDFLHPLTIPMIGNAYATDVSFRHLSPVSLRDSISALSSKKQGRSLTRLTCCISITDAPRMNWSAMFGLIADLKALVSLHIYVDVGPLHADLPNHLPNHPVATIDVEEVRRLQELKSLTQLSIRGLRFTSRGYSAIPDTLPNLCVFDTLRVHCFGTDMDPIPDTVSRLGHLHTLQLYTDGISDEVMRKMVSMLPELKFIQPFPSAQWTRISTLFPHLKRLREMCV